MKELKTYANPDAKVFLIGNKKDLEKNRQVNTKTGEEYKSDLGLDYFLECSAKTGFNSQEVFTHACLVLYNDYLKYNKSRDSSFKNISDNKTKLSLGTKVKDDNQDKNKGCCN